MFKKKNEVHELKPTHKKRLKKKDFLRKKCHLIVFTKLMMLMMDQNMIFASEWMME